VDPTSIRVILTASLLLDNYKVMLFLHILRNPALNLQVWAGIDSLTVILIRSIKIYILFNGNIHHQLVITKKFKK